jgi:excisionase family DNA binding protein
MVSENAERQLISLKDAAARLGVHPSTLRRWADNGDILVMVTPGGHRRFPVREIERLASEVKVDDDMDSVGAHLVENALERARSEMAHADYTWTATLTDEQKEGMRAMGRRVMSLLERFVSADDDAGLIDEAAVMGREYAASTKELGMALSTVLHAVTFFRGRILEAAVSLPEADVMSKDKSTWLIRKINAFLNAILIAVAEAYEESAV